MFRIIRYTSNGNSKAVICIDEKTFDYELNNIKKESINKNIAIDFSTDCYLVVYGTVF